MYENEKWKILNLSDIYLIFNVDNTIKYWYIRWPYVKIIKFKCLFFTKQSIRRN